MHNILYLVFGSYWLTDDMQLVYVSVRLQIATALLKYDIVVIMMHIIVLLSTESLAR